MYKYVFDRELAREFYSKNPYLSKREVDEAYNGWMKRCDGVEGHFESRNSILPRWTMYTDKGAFEVSAIECFREVEDGE